MSKKILVVDDDSDVRDALIMILESTGYKVITASDGLEGLACLKAEKPDLMILDLMMPKLDGFGVLKELREPTWEETKNVPILVLSAVREEASRRRFELETGGELGTDDYIEKPFSPDILLQRIERVIKKRKSI